MSRKNRHAQAGFTLVEVMIAIGIMTVGSLGILSMHQAVSNANRSAQEMNTALAITERWIERIERDSLSWTEQGVTSTSLSGTNYLSTIAGSVGATDWFRPAVVGEEHYAANYFGADVTDTSEIKYCTNLRLHWIRQGSSVRVDVRTFWYRAGYLPGGATHPNWVSGSDFRGADCEASTVDGWNLETAPNVDTVFASTIVTWLRRDGT